jgi:pyruvate dehydrogenase E1 component alpha subunit
MTDPAKYRTQAELDDQKKLDPILILKALMLKDKMISEDEFKAMDDELKKTVTEAVAFAEQSPEPELRILYDDVLV